MDFPNRGPTRRLVLMLAVATAFDGLRAGAGTFRLLIDLPARARMGPAAFAAFSRATDLSSAGVVFYAIYGIGGGLLTAATWLVAKRSGASRAIRRLTTTAFVSSMLILAATTQAAPLMWRVRTSEDSTVLTDLFDRFTAWTTFRILCADVSFVVLLGALTLCSLRLDRVSVDPSQRESSSAPQP